MLDVTPAIPVPPDSTAPAGASDPAGTSVYGLPRPTIADLRLAIAAVHGPDAERVWRQLLAASGLTGAETGVRPLTHLITTACASGDTALALCGRAQRIRLIAHQRLSAAHAVLAAAGPASAAA